MKSILFSAPMVLAVLAGRKTVTRRLANTFTRNLNPGDMVYGKEAWRLPAGFSGMKPSEVGLVYDDFVTRIRYECDGKTNLAVDGMDWGRCRSPLHMPEWASRILLRIVNVREERLHLIDEADAAAEGVERLQLTDGWQSHPDMDGGGFYGHPITSAYREAFATLWDSLHCEGFFATNPTVARIQFEVLK